MMQFLIAAPRSGSGKTTITCAVLTALQRRGADPCAFKCGPDYIDPMFHRSALGVESHNLDLYLSAPDTVRTLYARYAAGHGAAVCEGAMGFYDGQGLTTRAPLLPSCRGFCSSARPAISWAFCSTIAPKPYTKRCARCWKPRPG